MYHDGPDFDHHLDCCYPGRDEPLPARPHFPRLLGAALFGLLVVLHACS